MIEYRQITEWIDGKHIFLVCGRSFDNLAVKSCFEQPGIVRFSEFSPNPTYESVILGLKEYKRSNCNSIVAVGGGSAIDVAKCIKLFSTMPDDCNYLEQQFYQK